MSKNSNCIWFVNHYIYNIETFSKNSKFKEKISKLFFCDYGWIRTNIAYGNLLPQFNFVKKLYNVFSSDIVAHPICFT